MSRVGKKTDPDPRRASTVAGHPGRGGGQGAEGDPAASRCRRAMRDRDGGRPVAARASRAGRREPWRSSTASGRSLVANAVHRRVARGSRRSWTSSASAIGPSVAGQQPHVGAGLLAPDGVRQCPTGSSRWRWRTRPISWSVGRGPPSGWGRSRRTSGALRKPDPYKQKGVRYTGEVLKKKVGKTGA